MLKQKVITNLELPLGKRTRFYRFFEILTPTLTYSVLILAVVLSICNVLYGAIYILVLVCWAFVRGLGILYSTIIGRGAYNASLKVDWHQRLIDLRTGRASHYDDKEFLFKRHLQYIEAYRQKKNVLRIEDIYHLVIVAVYNESYDVVSATIQSLIDTTYDKQRMIICIAYEERGGRAGASVARRLKNKFANNFADFITVCHPDGLPNEVIGKGGNITYAAQFMSRHLQDQKIDAKNVVVTTLDSDNKPHPMYFDYVTYEYVIYKDRHQLSFQPISMFLNNIWDAPAPARVIATGNSFWNLISSARPYALRNFASHSQPLSALEEMNYWSTRTIVEDGHQYWRSYFHFRGHYAVVPIYLPIYQDAVCSDSYRKTLRSQFMQLRRWAYGVSDVPYVAQQLFKNRSTDSPWRTFVKFIILIEGHVTLGSLSIIIAIGGWIPLILNDHAHSSIVAHQLPIVISSIQQLAMLGLIITIIFSLLMLPPRPKRYSKLRNLLMVLQWILIPLTSILYNSVTALYSQGRLMLGKYLDKFDVTDKTIIKE